MGEAVRRVSAGLLSFVLLASALPGTNWTLAPIDPEIRAGDFALVRVDTGAAELVAATAGAAGATDVTALDAIDVVVARVSADALTTLRRDPRVDFIAADGVVTAAGRRQRFERTQGRPSPALQVIDAEKAWATATGRGVTVALMDTGIANHPDLAGSVVARVDFVKDGATRFDPSGHGTFMAGLIAAHGATFQGVAPDAKLVSLRVLDVEGRGRMRAVLGAFDWLLKNRARYKIEVLNLSFGATQRASYHRELLAGLVESAWFAGITVVAAAGNDGPNRGTVAMPGADPFVVTVGSFADRGTPAHQDDRESAFSGRGPTRDGFAKPDVLAPGEHVVSLRVPGTAMDLDAQGDDRSEPYGRLTGTSASTAIAAGVAALVLDAKPRYKPTQVKGALVAGARRVPGTRTPAVDADDSLTAHPARVNLGLAPSLVLVRLLVENGQLPGDVIWDGVSWEGVTWESVTWEGVTWEAVSWESVTWESVTWESVTWESVRVDSP
jgi:serine protease AprX